MLTVDTTRDIESVMAEAVVDPLRRFAEQRTDLIRTAFVTGSYAAGHWNRQRPNLNVYFIAHADRAMDLRLAAADLWTTIRTELAADGHSLHVDCHPFTLSQQPDAHRSGPPVTITSKVLEEEHRNSRYRLPPTIGPGWAANFLLLTGHPEDLDCLRAHPDRDIEWLRTLHQALSHYRNILDHLPWAVDREHSPWVLVEESCRYAEEAIKDSLALALTGEELRDGRHIALLADWARSAQTFIAERFGPDGVAAAALVAELKEAAARSEQADPAEALAAWRTAQSVMAWAWAQYLPVARELSPETTGLTRLDAFL